MKKHQPKWLVCPRVEATEEPDTDYCWVAGFLLPTGEIFNAFYYGESQFPANEQDLWYRYDTDGGAYHFAIGLNGRRELRFYPGERPWYAEPEDEFPEITAAEREGWL